ncbi:MAG: hypothetical protein ACOCU4_07220, partial [Alkalispirochaeta sp.]
MVFVSFLLRVLSATAVSFLLAIVVGDQTSPWDEAYRTVLSRAEDPVPVAEELLVIEGPLPLQAQGEEDIAPGELLWTIAELGADRVLLPHSWGDTDLATISASESDAAVTSRIAGEFSRIDENIVELFDGIRLGSIAPGEADRFVAHLRELVAESTERVQEAVSQISGTSRRSVADVVAALGNDRVALELPQLGITPPGYPVAGAPLRRLPVSSLRRYRSEYDQFMTRMYALEEAGYFEQADPQEQPRVMGDYLRSLRRELYEGAPESSREDWESATARHLAVAGELIRRERQAALLERLEALEGEEGLGDESAAQIRSMKEELAGVFAAARAEYAALMAIREELISAIDGSFVILEDGAHRSARAAVANNALVGEQRSAPVGWP